MKLVYTSDAVTDLSRLRSFIQQKNPQAAQRVAAELVDRLESIPAFPGIGKIVEELSGKDTIRDMVFGKFVVRYSVHPNTIIVLRIWHHFEERDLS